MKKSFLLFVFLLTTSHTIQSEEFFSHAIVNLPYDLYQSGSWYKVLNSQEEWELFYLDNLSLWWDRPSGEEEVPVLDVDFKNYTLVIGGPGNQPTTGSVFSIQRVWEWNDEIRISAINVTYCGGGDAITFPSVGVLINKTDKYVRAYLEEFGDCR